MTVEQQLELMRGMMNDLIVKVDAFVEASGKRDAEYASFAKIAIRRDLEYHKLRERVLKGALGLLGADENEGAEPPAN